ncbi:hypothetical protein RFI_11762 [Reticulomyxa filosa]|uniref:Uncharacterized protein n=1 Tax=Reticulomyxa filosa TaxID=46433 RepID=X6NGF5_RETFI|nr:hypothetical protein RFI_11762 [Reticulomyxa filosa]|eukprot:ETO25375.1 hypothetical protein RFI_11762 [Reticulomyxa filosa]
MSQVPDKKGKQLEKDDSTLFGETVSAFEKVCGSIKVPFVIFSNQTAVFYRKKEWLGDESKKKHIIQKCCEIMQKQGPLAAGTLSEECDARQMQNLKGWLVFYAFEGMYTYVSKAFEMVRLAKDESDTESAALILNVALHGRSKRDRDGKLCRPVYWSDVSSCNETLLPPFSLSKTNKDIVRCTYICYAEKNTRLCTFFLIVKTCKFFFIQMDFLRIPKKRPFFNK